MRAKFLLQGIVLCCALATASLGLSSEENTINLKDISCASGSLDQLYDFFIEHKYVILAQGNSNSIAQLSSTKINTLFLLSPDMNYFHVVTLKELSNKKLEGCIFLSAREVDFQFTSPKEGLLTRKNRNHFVFHSDIPKNTSCPSEDNHCQPWHSNYATEVPILTAYEYSLLTDSDPYEEIVELTIDKKVIRPSRGTLSELSRNKYSARLNNQYNESEEDLEEAKKVYKNIHDEVDHQLALIAFYLKENKAWEVIKIDRVNGLTHKLITGKNLQAYPLPDDSYVNF